MDKLFSKQQALLGRIVLFLNEKLYFDKLFSYPSSYIGVITGVRSGVFSISMNERYGINCGYVGLIEWIFNINSQQQFITFAMRDMLANATSYDQAVRYLAEIKLTAPCYYIIAGPQPGQVRLKS